MAYELTLKKGTGTILNLLTGDVQVQMEGWETQAGSPGAAVWERFDLVSKAASDALYLAALNDLQDFLVCARKYASNPLVGLPCWLHFKPDNGVEVRALVVDGDIKLPATGHLSALLGETGHGFAQLTLARMPWWEATSETTVTGSAINVIGGTWAPSLTLGNLPGRIRSLKISGHATEQLGDMWVGWKPTYEGVAAFNPVWEAENGTNGTDAADAGDATASGGNRVTISFATSAAMVERFRVSCSQILGGTYNDMIGNYLVLGRVKSSSAVTSSQRFLIRLYHGLLGGLMEFTGETTFTPDSTTWRLVELGFLRIPPTGYRFDEGTHADLWCASTTLYFYAQRLSGTASLYVDCLILIPTEPIMTVKSAAMTGSASDYTKFYGSPMGDATVVVFDSGTSSFSMRKFSAATPMVLPQDGGVMVYAAQQENDSKLTTASDVELLYVPRYPLFRET